VTKNALAAYRANPRSAQGTAFASAMTKAFGQGALSASNLSKLDSTLGKLSNFYNDPGTARGGKYDVYKASDWGDGGTIRGGQVAFGTGYFSGSGTFNRMATIHEPMHLQGFNVGRDVSWKFPDGNYYPVYSPYWVKEFAKDSPAAAKSNVDNWACLISGFCK
jgi:hypothetical protein